MTGGDSEVSGQGMAVLAIVAVAGPIGTGEIVRRYAGAEDEVAASRSLSRLSQQGLAGREISRSPEPGLAGRWTATGAGRPLLARHAGLVAEVIRSLAGREFRPPAAGADTAPAVGRSSAERSAPAAGTRPHPQGAPRRPHR
jgi:hypothetical protein